MSYVVAFMGLAPTEYIEAGIVSRYARLVVPSIGSNLKRLRGKRGQKDIAKAMGVPQPQISDWERDRHGTLDLATIFRLAVAYNCTIEDIVAGVDAHYGDRRDLVRPGRDLESGLPQDVGGPLDEATAARLQRLEEENAALRLALDQTEDVRRKARRADVAGSGLSRESMNTCAECRFWKDVDVSTREFTFNPATWRDEGQFKECTLVNNEDSPMFMATSHSYDDALMTRSDFGCVQFEASAPTPTTETETPASQTGAACAPSDQLSMAPSSAQGSGSQANSQPHPEQT